MSSNLELVVTPSFSADNRKATAAKACEARDGEVLVALLYAYVRAEGRKGFRTSPATLQTYSTGLLRWIDWCWPDPKDSPRVKLLRATRDDVQTFLAYLADEGRREATVQAYLAAVRAFYRALEWCEMLKVNPADRVRAPADPRPPAERCEMVPFDLYKKLLTLSRERGGHAGLRDVAMLRLFGDCGLRVAEATALELKDLDLERRLLTVQKGKGSKKRRVPLPVNAVPDLEVWVRRRRPLAVAGQRAVLINVGKHCKVSAYGRKMTTGGVRSILERLYLEAGVPASVSGPHALRHTAGAQLYAITGDIYAVASFLGHSDINTSAIYAALDLNRLRKSLDRMYEDE